jgi:hypothetical protein
MIVVNKIAVMYRAAVRRVGGSDTQSITGISDSEKLPSNSVGFIIIQGFYYYYCILTCQSPSTYLEYYIAGSFIRLPLDREPC